MHILVLLHCNTEMIMQCYIFRLFIIQMESYAVIIHQRLSSWNILYQNKSRRRTGIIYIVWHVTFMVKGLGCSLNTCTVHCVCFNMMEFSRRTQCSWLMVLILLLISYTYVCWYLLHEFGSFTATDSTSEFNKKKSYLTFWELYAFEF